MSDWWKVARRLVAGLLDGEREGPSPGDEKGPDPEPVEPAAHRLARSILQGRGAPPVAEPPLAACRAALKPGWPLRIEGFDDAAAAADLERLVALPIEERRGAALAAEVEPKALLIISLLDTATALREVEPSEADSIADAALLLTTRASAAGQECRYLFDNITDYWLKIIEVCLHTDQLANADYCLSFLEQLAQLGGNEPERAARIGINRAQLHWERAEVEATLTELEAALVHAELAKDKSFLTTALYYQGLALATAGQPSAAREALERCRTVAPPGEEHFVAGAEVLLCNLEELL